MSVTDSGAMRHADVPEVEVAAASSRVLSEVDWGEQAPKAPMPAIPSAPTPAPFKKLLRENEPIRTSLPFTEARTGCTTNVLRTLCDMIGRFRAKRISQTVEFCFRGTGVFPQRNGGERLFSLFARHGFRRDGKEGGLARFIAIACKGALSVFAAAHLRAADVVWLAATLDAGCGCRYNGGN